MLTIDQAQSRLGETFGSSVWTMRFLNNEKTSRQLVWQRYHNAGNLSDTLRMMECNEGIMLESRRVPARFNVIKDIEELEIWIEDYKEQTNEQI